MSRFTRKLRIRKAYKPHTDLSIETVPPNLWLFMWLMTIFVMLGGVILISLLSLGIANPPRAGSLYWRAESVDDWQLWQEAGDFELLSAPTSIPMTPFTLELTADNSGTADSAWGIALQTSNELWTLLVSREGYFSISTDDRAHWAEFLHIRRTGSNKLYINVDEHGAATVRINDEIAWKGALSMAENAAWGIVHYRQPHLSWSSIDIYS